MVGDLVQYYYLYKCLNTGVRTYLVQDAESKPPMAKKFKIAGITAGASTRIGLLRVLCR